MNTIFMLDKLFESIKLCGSQNILYINDEENKIKTFFWKDESLIIIYINSWSYEYMYEYINLWLHRLSNREKFRMIFAEYVSYWFIDWKFNQ